MFISHSKSYESVRSLKSQQPEDDQGSIFSYNSESSYGSINFPVPILQQQIVPKTTVPIEGNIENKFRKCQMFLAVCLFLVVIVLGILLITHPNQKTDFKIGERHRLEDLQGQDKVLGRGFIKFSQN